LPKFFVLPPPSTTPSPSSSFPSNLFRFVRIVYPSHFVLYNGASFPPAGDPPFLSWDEPLARGRFLREPDSVRLVVQKLCSLPLVFAERLLRSPRKPPFSYGDSRPPSLLVLPLSNPPLCSAGVAFGPSTFISLCSEMALDG